MKKLLVMMLCCLWAVGVQAQEETKDYGLVNLSVCNVRSEARFTAGMETQALLGMPVRVLDVAPNGWYHIELPDNYKGWVHYSAIKPMSRTELSQWNRSEQVVVTALFSVVRERKSSGVVSDVVAGDRLQLIAAKGRHFMVRFPDGREGCLPKTDAALLSKWQHSTKWDADGILHTAYGMNGFPYLWAGTSAKGMDCSGFVRQVLLMHNVIIPRDAYQQAAEGERIVIADDLANLQAGDLLFFGRKAQDGGKEKVDHVGIYMGNGRFIHSQGLVHVSGLNEADALYDAFNKGRLLYASRILPYINKVPNMMTTERIPLYQ